MAYPNSNIFRMPTISTEAAKDALMREVSSHCCYGKKAAEEVNVTSTTPSSAFHVRLTVLWEWHISFILVTFLTVPAWDICWGTKYCLGFWAIYRLVICLYPNIHQAFWHSGQQIDGPQNGRAPSPWEISVQPPDIFKDFTKELEVPHTASVQVCHGCSGTGTNQCKKCSGHGKVSRCHHNQAMVSILVKYSGHMHSV